MKYIQRMQIFLTVAAVLAVILSALLVFVAVGMRARALQIPSVEGLLILTVFVVMSIAASIAMALKDSSVAEEGWKKLIGLPDELIISDRRVDLCVAAVTDWYLDDVRMQRLVASVCVANVHRKDYFETVIVRLYEEGVDDGVIGLFRKRIDKRIDVLLKRHFSDFSEDDISCVVLEEKICKVSCRVGIIVGEGKCAALGEYLIHYLQMHGMGGDVLDRISNRILADLQRIKRKGSGNDETVLVQKMRSGMKSALDYLRLEREQAVSE